MRRGAEAQTEQGTRLSEPSGEFERDPGWAEHRRLRLLGSDANFAAVQSTAPAGRAFGSANLDSDPKNRRRHQGRLFFCLLYFWRSKRKVSRQPRRQSGIRTWQSARSLDQKQKLGSGRFEGQSPNSPSLRLALRVLRSKIVIRPSKPIGSPRSEVVTRLSKPISLRCMQRHQAVIWPA
jgi:hypothetical protein